MTLPPLLARVLGLTWVAASLFTSPAAHANEWLLQAAPGAVSIGVAIGTPPPPPRYGALPPPQVSYAWAPGYWAWDGYRYRWVDGRWLQQVPGYRYVPERWEEHRQHWYFQEGHWEPHGHPHGPERGDWRDTPYGHHRH